MLTTNETTVCMTIRRKLYTSLLMVAKSNELRGELNPIGKVFILAAETVLRQKISAAELVELGEKVSQENLAEEPFPVIVELYGNLYLPLKKLAEEGNTTIEKILCGVGLWWLNMRSACDSDYWVKHFQRQRNEKLVQEEKAAESKKAAEILKSLRTA